MLSDETLSDLFTTFNENMVGKYVEKRKEYGDSWVESNPEYLKLNLIEHVFKGDMVDVANLAFMLHFQEQINKPVGLRDKLGVPIIRIDPSTELR